MLRTLAAGLMACHLALAHTPALAQDYPTKPLRMVVGYAPGGGTDMIARLMSQQLSTRLGQPVVVDNRPGAGGNIGSEVVAKAPADGYTLLMAANTVAINPFLYKDLAFDVARDLTGVAMIASAPVVVVMHPDVPIKSIAELIAYAKQHPGKLSYATPGVGTPQHLAGELFKSMTGTDIVHVPYKGGAPAMAAVAGGQVQMSFAAINSAQPLIQADRLRALAIGDAKRLTPDGLPTIGETVPGYEVPIWWGIMAPAGTPRPIVERLSRELGEIVKMPDVAAQMVKQGFVNAYAPSEGMNARVRADLAQWGRVSKEAGIKPE